MLRLLSLHGKARPPRIGRKPDHLGEHRVTLWGKEAKLIALHVPERCLNEALLLELNYLKEGLASRAEDRSDKAFVYDAYAVLTACRTLYSALHRGLVSKDQAYRWAMERVPALWRAVIHAARENRLKNRSSTTRQFEQFATRFVEFVADEINNELMRPGLIGATSRTSRQVSECLASLSPPSSNSKGPRFESHSTRPPVSGGGSHRSSRVATGRLSGSGYSKFLKTSRSSGEKRE